MARVLLADLQPLFNEALEALFSRGGHTVVGRCASAEETLVAVACGADERGLQDPHVEDD